MAPTCCRNVSIPSASTAFERALRDDVGALPVGLAVERDQHRAGADGAPGARWIGGGVARQPEPQHVDRRAEVVAGEARAAADRGVAAVGGHHQVGADGEPFGAALRLHADDTALLLDHRRRLGAGEQRERGQLPRPLRDEIQEVPLRDQHQEVARSRHVREVGDGDQLAVDLARQLGDLLVRQLQEVFEQPEVIQDRQRRRVDGVAAKVTQEVVVLFEDGRLHAGAREQVAEHEAGRAAAGDAALRGEVAGHRGMVARHARLSGIRYPFRKHAMPSPVGGIGGRRARPDHRPTISRSIPEPSP
jgi:hypothetical protein